MQMLFILLLVNIFITGKTQIIGGENISIQRVPFQVSIRYKDEHRCGGSILDKNTILTAAHCTNNKDYQKFSVRLGHEIHHQGEKYEIEQIFEHEYYNGVIYDYDIAIIKLTNSLNFTKQIQPIQLQPVNTDFLDGVFASVSGWGALDENHSKNDWPESLKIVHVQLVNNKVCQKIFQSEMKYHIITNNMLCAFTPEKDACKGDSGGPLTLNGKLIGVVSWGIGCANSRFPGVYVRLSIDTIHKWITQFIK